MRIGICLLVWTSCYYEVANNVEGTTKPGRIDVAPPAVVLTPGATRRVTPVLLTSDSVVETTQPVFSFESEDETIAKVGATGEIEAVMEGDTTIEVGDGEHGITLVEVAVRSNVPSGPAVLACSPSLIVVAVGARTMPTISVFDAAGTPQPLSAVTLQLDTTIAKIVGAELEGVGRGTTVLTAVASDGTQLLGSCTIYVGGTSDGAGGTLPELDMGCWVVKAPRWMSRPGLSRPVRVSQITTQWSATGEPTRINVIQGSPDSIVFDTAGVATGFGSQIVGTSPGTTNVRIERAGQLCGEGRLVVGVDLGGEWSVTCANEDRGKVVLAPTPKAVALRRQDAWAPSGSGGRTEVLVARSVGTGVYCGRDAFSCGGEARGSVAIVGPESGGAGRCGTCRGAGISDCASSRHAGPVSLQGPDRIVAGDCTYTRGSQDLDCEVSACSPRGSFCSGTSLTFCIEDDRCFYEVNAMRFPCASCQDLTDCAMQAAAYGRMRCDNP